MNYYINIIIFFDKRAIFMLQRLLGTDRASCQAIESEVAFAKQLSGHPGIVDFVGCNIIENSNTSHGKKEYQLLTELCTGMYYVFTKFTFNILLECGSYVYNFNDLFLWFLNFYCLCGVPVNKLVFIIY